MPSLQRLSKGLRRSILVLVKGLHLNRANKTNTKQFLLSSILLPLYAYAASNQPLKMISLCNGIHDGEIQLLHDPQDDRFRDERTDSTLHCGRQSRRG